MGNIQVQGMDALDQLSFALHGRKATPRDFLGGSNANILGEAAERISALRVELAEWKNIANTYANESAALKTSVSAWRPTQNQCLEMANIYRYSEETEEAFLALTEYVRHHMIAPPEIGKPLEKCSEPTSCPEPSC